MNRIPDSVLPKIVDFAFIIGAIIGIACLVASYTFDTNSKVGALLINLAGDFFMAGLTISVVDKLIKRTERQKLGGVPNHAKTTINDEILSLIGVMSFNIRNALNISQQEIIDSIMVDQIQPKEDLVRLKQRMDLAHLKNIDKEKLTLGMFSEMLRYILQTLRQIDKLIARYEAVLDPEDISKAITLRDRLEKVGSAHSLTTITIPFFGQQTPDKFLTSNQRSAFMSINSEIIDLVDILL